MKPASKRTANRRTVLAGLAAAAATPFHALAEPSDAMLSFLVLGDWGRRGSSAQRRVAQAMAVAADGSASRFVVSVGDNFYESGTRSVDDSHWRESFEGVYTAPSLQIPWYAVLGNHDYAGLPQSQVDYSAKSSRWRMPQRYYHVDGAVHGAPGLEVFFLDTTALVLGFASGASPDRRAGAEAQRAWLDEQLGKSMADWKLVVGHHPIFSGGFAHGDTPQMKAVVQPLLDAHRVQAYFCGHDHDMQHIRRGEIDYVVCGAGAEVRPTRRVAGSLFARSHLGFASVVLSGGGLTLEFRGDRGENLYRAPLAPKTTA